MFKQIYRQILGHTFGQGRFLDRFLDRHVDRCLDRYKVRFKDKFLDRLGSHLQLMWKVNNFFFQFFSQPWNSLVSSYVTWFIKCVQKAADGQKQVEKVGIEESRNSLRPCNEIFPTWPNWSWKVSPMTPMGSLQSNVSRITITFYFILDIITPTNLFPTLK